MEMHLAGAVEAGWLLVGVGVRRDGAQIRCRVGDSGVAPNGAVPVHGEKRCQCHVHMRSMQREIETLTQGKCIFALRSCRRIPRR